MMSPPPSLLETLEPRWFEAHPLQQPEPDDDKEGRGKVVIVAGCREMPGAAILAATAAMRVGAGKLVIATAAGVAGVVAAAVPEARVVPLAEGAAGQILARSAATIAELVDAGDAVLLGPGMQDEDAACQLVAALWPQLRSNKVAFDAIAMDAFRAGMGLAPTDAAKSAPASAQTAQRETPQWVLTPHAGEMAHLTGVDKSEVLNRPLEIAQTFARDWNAIVVLKGARTFIASPDEPPLLHVSENPGLAISGSGDVLAGLVAGLLARGMSARQSAAWAVGLHAAAGAALAGRIGPLGFLAREISAEVPGLLTRLAQPAEADPRGRP